MEALLENWCLGFVYLWLCSQVCCYTQIVRHRSFSLGEFTWELCLLGS